MKNKFKNFESLIELISKICNIEKTNIQKLLKYMVLKNGIVWQAENFS